MEAVTTTYPNVTRTYKEVNGHVRRNLFIAGLLEYASGTIGLARFRLTPLGEQVREHLLNPTQEPENG